MTYFAEQAPTIYSNAYRFFLCQFKRIILISAVIVGVMSAPVFAGQPPVIPKQDATATLDGKMNEEVWKKVLVLNRFALPWNPEEQPARTELRLFNNGKQLFFFYTVEEKSLLIADPFKEEFDVASEDRIEIVMEATKNLKQYYCCEIDYRGHILDYSARFFRNFDFSWTFPNLQVAGTRTEKGYNVEGSYDLETLRMLNILKPDNTITAGFYRADFRKLQDGSVLELWYCRVKPKTDHPEYHVPGMMEQFKVE